MVLVKMVSRWKGLEIGAYKKYGYSCSYIECISWARRIVLMTQFMICLPLKRGLRDNVGNYVIGEVVGGGEFG